MGFLERSGIFFKFWLERLRKEDSGVAGFSGTRSNSFGLKCEELLENIFNNFMKYEIKKFYRKGLIFKRRMLRRSMIKILNRYKISR